jgi:hypothetical protein
MHSENYKFRKKCIFRVLLILKIQVLFAEINEQENYKT